MMNLLAGKTVLVTGGSGSFGHAFVRRLLSMHPGPKRVAIYSRDELKQSQMAEEFHHDHRLRFFIGDCRDLARLRLAFRDADIVVHAAALKQVPGCEYNPLEAVKTNIGGAENVIQAAVDCAVPRVVFLSTDKATNPVNLYGATKLVAERLFTAANSYAKDGVPIFASTRYGNVAHSRGSVVPLFKWKAAAKHALPITHPDMSRFWMTLDEAVDLVLLALHEMRGGEVFIPKLPAYRLIDLAHAIGGPDAKLETVGVRPGEKLHESLIGPDESRQARDYGTHYRLLPLFHPWRDARDDGGKTLPDGYEYRSDTTERLSVEDLRVRLGLGAEAVA